MQTRVLIADDHPLFRAAMYQALTDIVGTDILQAASLDEAIEQLNAHQDVELVFLDLSMPGNEGMSGLLELRSKFPDVMTVIVTAHEDPELVQRALLLGASGFIPKSASVERIADAVETVLEGEQWLPEELSFDGSSTDSSVAELSKSLASLTPHQLKVLQMIADGLLNKQIAFELDISESTVKQHVSAILKKMGVINRTKAGIAYKHAMAVKEESIV